MRYITDFISEYGFQIVFTILSAVAAYFGAKIKKVIEEREISDEKRKAVKTVCNAVEQLYHDIDGAEKLEKAKENVVELLSAKGIEITEIELSLLIEAAVAEMNLPFFVEEKTERLAAK